MGWEKLGQRWIGEEWIEKLEVKKVGTLGQLFENESVVVASENKRRT